MNQIWLAFITGITTGGLSCLAVQGGLLASSVAQNEEVKIAKVQKWQKVGMFLVAKLLAYTILGFLLGLLGSKLIITPEFQGWLQIFAGLFMLATAGRLLNLHPVFRYFIIQPPKFVLRIVRSQSRDTSLFAPALMGFSTILIPCGVTQSMMVLAVAQGKPILGALIMLAFTLGTSPVFFALGVATVELIKRKWFSYIASAVIIILGIISINTGQTLRGSAHTLANYYWAITDSFGFSAQASGQVAGISTRGIQEVNINVLSQGYFPSATTLKAGIPVKLNLITNNVFGCTRGFNIPTLKISKVLPQTGQETVEFTPTQKGRLVYTCSMGMFSGSFEVI